MYRRLFLVFLFGISTLKGSVSLPSNLISASEKEDTLEVKAEEIVKEAEKIFEETESSLEERRNRIIQFSNKITKILTAPFIKAITKVTLIEMELICSSMPDLESAGFATFPQSYILLEVLGKNVDSGLMIKALSNRINDWKFRWLIAEMLGTNLYIKEAADVMMEIILDKSDNQHVRSKCISEVPAIGKSYQGKPIGDYILKIFKEEKELRFNAARALGYLKYKPAIEVLLESFEKDTSEMSRIVMVRSLGYIGDKGVLPGMFTALKDKKIRGYAAEQLGKIGGAESIDTLINIVKNDKDSFVRYCAANGLALSENERAYEFLINRKAVRALGEAARRGHVKALDALKDIGTSEALEKLRWLSTKGGSGSKRIRERAKVLLKEFEGEE